MGTRTFVHRSRMPVPAEELYAWHLRPGAFARLQPPWDAVEYEGPRDRSLAEGDRVELKIPVLGPIRQTWVAEHRGFVPGRQFQDVQHQGPFRTWEHTHSCEPDGEDASFLEDRIVYEPPLGELGHLGGGAFLRSMLSRMFAYRHASLRGDLEAHSVFADAPRLHVVITGASGLVGSALTAYLTTAGHRVTRLVRRDPGDGEARWDPARGEIDQGALEGADAVVHLAGESVAAGRWTVAQKERIRWSRVKGTQLIARTMAACDAPPSVLVSASAVGIYGDTGDRAVDEDAGPGEGFLADVGVQWEAETQAAEDVARVVRLRFGVVLSPAGGALARMLPPFRAGIGGVLGSGKQYMPWISLDDTLGVIERALHDDTLVGAVNAVAPEAVTNREFTRTLGRVLSRPTVFPMPAFVARAAFGEMAQAVLLAGQRVAPQRLIGAGHAFRHPDLETALRHVLGRPA